MSTLKTHNLQSPDAGSVNIALAPNAGMVVTGISTFNSAISGTTGSFSQNIAIRLSSATNNLHVHQDDSDKSILQFSNNTTGTATGDGFQIGISGDEEAVIDMKESKPIIFSTGGTEKFKIHNTGYAEFAGASDVRLTLGSAGTAGTNDANWIRAVGNNLYYNAATSDHIWEIGGTNHMTLRNDGNLYLRSESANYVVLGSSGDATSGGATNSMNWIRGNQTNLQYNSNGGFHGFEVSGSEKFKIEADGNLVQNLSSPSGTSPYQDSHWYDREGGHYTLSATDDNSLTAVKTDSNNDYNDIVYKRVRMSKNCDIEFELKGNSPAGLYRHVGFVINGDGTGTHSNWDRLVFRSRPGNTNLNLVRLDKGGGGTGLSEESSDVPTFFDGTERHILIQIREKLVNVIVDGVIIVSEKTNADFVRSQGWFGFGIYEGGENAQVTIRNLSIRNKFQRPHWIVKATGVNVDVGSGNVLPFNSVVKASSSMANTSDYNNGSYRFNVPLSGVYFVFVRAYRNSSTGTEIAFYVNGNVHSRFRPVPNGGDYIFHGSALIELEKGDYIDVRSFNGTLDNFYGNSGEQWSAWGGHLID
jgi:hypothetical protein